MSQAELVAEQSPLKALTELAAANESPKSEKRSVPFTKDRDYTSFNELYTQATCPWKWYDTYVLGHRSQDSIFTIFGSATGVAIEQYILHNNKQSWLTYIKSILKFVRNNPAPQEELDKTAFKDWCKKQEIDISQKSYELYCKKVHCKAALKIYKDLVHYFANDLKDWDVVSFEIPLLEAIEDIDLNFKGYIDCILKHKTEDRYKIIDFKTCGQGWFKEQRGDTEKLYQVILYKKFWCALNKIETSKVDCGYLLLKRMPSKNESAVEMFDITSGDKKLKNAEVWMLQTLRGIFQQQKIKTPQTCNFCVCSLRNRRRYF